MAVLTTGMPRTGPAIPAYVPQGNECRLFETAWTRRLPLLLKGPTGCGKTRFVSHMAARLGLPLVTVSCHDDLTAADLTGRFLLKGGDTVWVDGPLAQSVRNGGICYLDEIVEARKDVAVVLHPLTDDRRILPLERTGETLEAPSTFMLVASYNPGYQNILKALKPSTKQRFVMIEFDFLPRGQEIAIVAAESGLDEARVAPLVDLARKLRALKGQDIEEGVSTRLLVYCACLMGSGMPAREAVLAALIEPLTDEPDVKAALTEIASAVIA
ncbi:CbbQ/NirQ/NorQ/GpvN family protein [Phyllobacterium phragmitis]|uniref:AAA family ATPase n=1 Tax=Phyllobacterium phragmitis TaxID=2670329 RepID=A0ABQ0H2B9_9HYPH